jgi:hypothetical protein
VNDILDEAWAWLVKQLLNWALSTFDTFLTWWISGSGSAYNVQLTGEKGPGGVLYDLRLYTNWLTAAFAFAGFLVAAFRIAIQRRGAPFREALTQFFELAVIILTLATLVNLANIAGDAYSQWILEHMKPKGDAWKENWQNGLQLLGDDQDDVSFVLAFFALAAAISSAIQFVLMLFRSGALIVLVGILPAVAASRFSSYGNAAYRRCIGLLISFIIVKPVIATIDAAALKLMASPDYEADRLFGLALVAGSVFALPATLRAVMPAAAEGNSFFGLRQVGHFAYGGTSVTMRSRGLSLLGMFVPGGGSSSGSGGSGGSGGASGGASGGGGRGPVPVPRIPLSGRNPGGAGGGGPTAGSQGGSGGSPGGADGANASGGTEGSGGGAAGSNGPLGGPGDASNSSSGSESRSSSDNSPGGASGPSSVLPYPLPLPPSPASPDPGYTPPPPGPSASGASGGGSGDSESGPSGSSDSGSGGPSGSE